MSIKLEASDDTVVLYLKQLWNNNNLTIPQTNIVLTKTTNENNSINENNSKIINVTSCDTILVTELVADPKTDLVVESEEELKSDPKTDLVVESEEELKSEPKTDLVVELEDDNLPHINSANPEQVEPLELNTADKNQFQKQIKDNLNKIKEIGYRVYHNIELEKEVNLITNTVTNSDINQVYDFKVGTLLKRKSLIGNISRCVVFPKYKAGDSTNPENFRYLVNHHNTIKILDRIWCADLITKCGKNLPDRKIYKSALVKAFNGSIVDVAIKNTNSIDQVVLVDIKKAFDSLDWNVLEELLIANLTRKINKDTAEKLVSDYMIILKNRELYYNNNRIEISKGIPTGLPSSNVVFTLALEEILTRWFITHTNEFNINIDFIINVYVDDIYMRILKIDKSSLIVASLIQHLESYKLSVNKKKSKADEKLVINQILNKLCSTDYYLGIPFTRDIKLYGDLILSELNKKIKLSWIDIYDILSDNKPSDRKLSINGFLNYKLRPFASATEDFDKHFIKKFVFDNYIKEPKRIRDMQLKQIQYAFVVLASIAIISISILLYR